MKGRGKQKHRGSVHAYHPTAPGSNLSFLNSFKVNFSEDFDIVESIDSSALITASTVQIEASQFIKPI